MIIWIFDIWWERRGVGKLLLLNDVGQFIFMSRGLLEIIGCKH